MTDAAEADIVDALRAIIGKRKLKLADLARNLNIPYRNLQNYMYKKAKMPIDVYLRLCDEIGITADYPVSGRFRLVHHDLQQALLDIFGEEFFNSVEVDEHSRWTMGVKRPPDGVRVRRMASIFAGLVAGRYDTIREGELRPEEPEE